MDGQGRRLFKELSVKAAYAEDTLVGFVQYGKTAFGFDGRGEISSDVSYCVIRNLYFDKSRPDAGSLLLEDALNTFAETETVYAFFHYFGMSCFARHGKLFETHSHIAALLKEKGFETQLIWAKDKTHYWNIVKIDGKWGFVNKKGKVVIEEYLEGPEFSLLCFVNGKDVYPMPVAQDHKRAFDGDKGPNTGGMGAYTELPFITDEDLEYAMEKIMRPTAAAMVEEGCAFCGVLYGGLMKTQNGIKVIEFNARFGDPETEVILPRLTSDMCQVFCDVADGKTPVIEWDDQATLGVVLASKGYPGSYDKGYVIEGTEAVDGSIYHMGTALKDGKYVTSGGRVMIVVCKAPTLREAQQKAQAEVEKIKCENLFHRTDIGDKAFKY